MPPPENPRRAAYPFAEMEAGDSFFVPCTAGEAPRVYNRLAAASSVWVKRTKSPLVQAVRRVDGGYRVWMLAPSSAPSAQKGEK